jgi:UDP-N-acetyl-D-glucosamine dehydrogenase
MTIGNSAVELMQLINDRHARIGIIGMGYVGLPLAITSCRAGFRVTGFDVNQQRIAELNEGRSPIGRIEDIMLKELRTANKFEVTSDYAKLAECDVIVICVPTPLNKHREPDLSYVVNTTKGIAKHLRVGQLVSLESTTYPGTTKDVIRPILEEGGLQSTKDFFLAFSPEREDPGNPDFHTATIPKVVGGIGEDAKNLALAFYSSVVARVVPVSSCEVAEAVKLTENIFRSVNIALVNELKVIYAKMDIDVWEVIDAAKTKPFGYMPFYPGPGLGGHCIPIDPFYLTWKARAHDVPTRFIELAGEINTHMPYYVVDQLIDGLGRVKKKSLNGAKILLVGVAYKKNVEDTRESPAFTLVRLIEEKGGIVEFHDPFVPVVPMTREHPELAGRKSVPLSKAEMNRFDAALICTDHDNIDFAALGQHIDLIVDTRNAMKKVQHLATVIQA